MEEIKNGASNLCITKMVVVKITPAIATSTKLNPFFSLLYYSNLILPVEAITILFVISFLLIKRLKKLTLPLV